MSTDDTIEVVKAELDRIRVRLDVLELLAVDELGYRLAAVPAEMADKYIDMMLTAGVLVEIMDGSIGAADAFRASRLAHLEDLLNRARPKAPQVEEGSRGH